MDVVSISPLSVREPRTMRRGGSSAAGALWLLNFKKPLTQAFSWFHPGVTTACLKEEPCMVGKSRLIYSYDRRRTLHRATQICCVSIFLHSMCPNINKTGLTGLWLEPGAYAREDGPMGYPDLTLQRTCPISALHKEASWSTSLGLCFPSGKHV